MLNKRAFRLMYGAAWIIGVSTQVLAAERVAVTAHEGTEREVAEWVVDRAVAERANWGLAADRDTVTSLLASGRDTGSARLGIPMSAEEEQQLDLPGRMAFAAAVKRSVVPFVESLRTSGGVYIDQHNDGSLVVLLTERNKQVEDEIARRMPADRRGFRVLQVAYTEQRLRQALTRAWEAWALSAPGQTLLGAGLDIVQNRLVFEVEPSAVDQAEAAVSELAALLEVPVGVMGRPKEDSLDADCTSRDHCHGPTKAGVKIYKGAIDSVAECTMAFHVVCNDGDVEFVTAGHCGYGGSNNWYIKDGTADGLFLGAEQKTLYTNGGQDIMRVNLPVDEKSHKVYGESRVYGGSGACPLVGQAACASRGTTDVIDCGTVRTTWTSWVSSTANITVWGGDMNDVSSNPGDSGSPIFDRIDADHWGTVGVLNTQGALFAVLCKAETGLAITGKAY